MSFTRENLKGTFTAIVTPMSPDATNIDYASLDRVIDLQLEARVDGLVVCGSTGEAATLSDDEYRAVVQHTVKKVAGRIPVVAGIGTNATQRACEISIFLNTSGVDAVMLVGPAYNKPPQSGIVAHFEAVHRVSTLPLIAYNVPGRSAVNILPSTVATLVDRGIIIGLKDASGSLEQLLDTLALVGGKISIMSGEDSFTQALMAAGGQGVISVTSNIIPKTYKRLTDLCLHAEFREASCVQLRILSLIRAAFSESNPIPVKTALALKGVISNAAMRLPLMPAEKSTVERLSSLLANREVMGED